MSEIATFILHFVSAASSLGYPETEVVELLARAMERSGNPEVGARFRKEGLPMILALCITITNEKNNRTTHPGSSPGG